MKSKDFIFFKLRGVTNPLIVNRSSIEYIVPYPGNEMESKVHLKGDNENEYFVVDEPTSVIEEIL